MGLDPFGVVSRFWLRVVFNHEDNSSSFPVPVYQMRLRPIPRRHIQDSELPRRFSYVWRVLILAAASWWIVASCASIEVAVLTST